jgi:tRNA threonylcarbamoyl adenosine modification protein (Sua5/YciO/YrdC/YwlC family)
MISASDISQASRILRDGGLVAFPTETVYGLGGDATNDAAVARIYAAKGRPQFNPLISHLANAAQAFALGNFPPQAEKLAAQFWPGPLTIVVPRRKDCAVSLLASAGLDTIALRVPDHPLALALLKEVARPVAAPSANASGRISPTTADHVRQSLGDKAPAVSASNRQLCNSAKAKCTCCAPVVSPAKPLKPQSVKNFSHHPMTNRCTAPAFSPVIMHHAQDCD